MKVQRREMLLQAEQFRDDVKVVVAGQGIRPYGKFQSVGAHQVHRRQRAVDEKVRQGAESDERMPQHLLDGIDPFLVHADFMYKQYVLVEGGRMHLLQDVQEIEEG